MLQIDLKSDACPLSLRGPCTTGSWMDRSLRPAGVLQPVRMSGEGAAGQAALGCSCTHFTGPCGQARFHALALSP